MVPRGFGPSPSRADNGGTRLPQLSRLERVRGPVRICSLGTWVCTAAEVHDPSAIISWRESPAAAHAWAPPRLRLWKVYKAGWRVPVADRAILMATEGGWEEWSAIGCDECRAAGAWPLLDSTREWHLWGPGVGSSGLCSAGFLL